MICPGCTLEARVETAVVQFNQETKDIAYWHRNCWWVRLKPIK